MIGNSRSPGKTGLKALLLPPKNQHSPSVLTQYGSNRSSPRATPRKAVFHTHHSSEKKQKQRAATEEDVPDDDPVSNRLINTTLVKTPLTQSALSLKSPMTKAAQCKTQIIHRKPDREAKKEAEAEVRVTRIEPKKSIDLTSAAMQVLKSSVLLENKSCENINVSIRVRPFTQQEILAKQAREAWTLTPNQKLCDRKRAVVYSFGTSMARKADNRPCLLAPPHQSRSL